MASGHDKEEYDTGIWYRFVTGTVDKTKLLVISENEVQLLTNVLPWTPFEVAK